MWGEEVFLSREAQYEREKMYTPAPVPMTLNFAEIRGSYIKDHLSYAYIGDVKGDPLAAAAAMVCLIYECHMEYKHALFYRNWNK